MKYILVIGIYLSVLSQFSFGQIHNFKKMGVMNETFKKCCEEPSHNSYYEIFRNETLQSDNNRAVNQLLLDKFENTLKQLDKQLNEQLEQVIKEALNITIVSVDTADRIKYNIIAHKKMEKKLLDLTNKYWYKAKDRIKRTRELWDPEQILKEKVMLVSNTVDMIKPIKKAALLHNKFAFRVFSREELRNFTDAKLNTSLIIPAIAWMARDVYHDDNNKLMYSHFPGMGWAYHHKYSYLKNLREFDSMNNFSFKSSSFIKPSYLVNVTIPEINEWEEKLFNLYNTDAVLIEKLPTMSLGQGIRMQHNITSYIDGLKICKNEMETRPKDCPYYSMAKQGSKSSFDNTTLLQEYIRNPLLLDGRKFDMRTFVLNVWTGKHFIYFCHSLNIRRALNKYNLSSHDVKTIHATHTSAYDIYKQNNTYDKMLVKAQSHIPGFEEEFKKEHPENGDKLLKKLYHKQYQVLTYAILGGQHKLPMNEMKKGQHHLHGCDTMYDTDFNVWLMECNNYPQIRYTTPQKEHLMPKIAKYVVDIIAHFQDNWENMDEVALHPENIPNGEMKMIYNSATGYNIINEEFKDD